MNDVITYAIEVGVGISCIAIAIGMWRGSGRRWLACLLVVAGAAAVAHGILELATQ